MPPRLTLDTSPHSALTPVAVSHDRQVVEELCANCGAARSQEFCGACGTPRLESKPVTTRRFARELLNEVTNVDSATVRTLRALFGHPGVLTREYLAGRTRRFLSPVRIYLLMFAILVFGQSLLPDREAHYQQIEREARQQLDARDLARAARSGRASAAVGAPPVAGAAARRRLTLVPITNAEIAAATVSAARFVNDSPWVNLINVATWAALVALLFRHQRRNYAEHVVFALHLMAFNMVLLLLNSAVHTALGRSSGQVDAISIAHWLAIGSYFFLASRLLFAEGRTRTAVKSVLFVAGAQLSMIIVQTGAMLVAGVALVVRHVS